MTYDSSGNIWIGSDSGMAKYDGSKWTVFTHHNSALAAAAVMSIKFDTKNVMWFISYKYGIGKYDGTNLYYPMTQFNPMALCTDNSDNLWYLEYKSDVLTEYKAGKEYLNLFSGYVFTNLKADASGNIWLPAYNSIIKSLTTGQYNEYKFATTLIPNLSHTYTAMAFDDAKGEKWFGGNELIKYDGKSWTVMSTANAGLPSNNIRDIAIDKKHVKWIATDNGLAIFDGTAWNVMSTANTALPTNDVYATAFDAAGNVWMLTPEAVVVYKGK